MSASWREMWAAFGRIGIVSFGGPAAQIAVMQEELVDRRAWLDRDGFLRGLGFCTLLPGPEAMQLATYAGWRVRGTAGGLLAGLLFVLPGAAVMMALSAAYVAYGRVPWVEAAFLGIKAAVLAIVVAALWKLRAKVTAGAFPLAVAAGAFVALFVLGAPFWAVIGGALGIGLARPAPSGDAATLATAPEATPAPTPATTGRLRATARTVVVWLAVWWVPLLAVILLAPGSVPAQAAVFFSWLATVSFGGAYALLAALTQNAVEGYGWLGTEAMIDGLGLAETTPGPLVLVTVFAGWLGGAGAGGVALAMTTAVVTLWATFAPCFLWIFAGAPHLERLAAMPRLRGALETVTAAVAGVIANLSAWFALHVLFREVAGVRPVLSTLDPVALGLAVLAAACLWSGRVGLLPTLGLCAAAGLGLHVAGIG